MRYRLRTIMLAIAASAAQIYAGTEASKNDCLGSVAIIWGGFVGVPLGSLVALLAFAPAEGSRNEASRDKIIAIFGAFAILGYLVAIPACMLVIGLSRAWAL